MSNCSDCKKYAFCPLVQGEDVDVYAENIEQECEFFAEELSKGEQYGR